MAEKCLESSDCTPKTKAQIRAALLNLHRKSGIPYLQDLPWGTHLCAFYETEDDLLEIAVPYLRAGFESNEYCMWITAAPYPYTAANTLTNLMPDLTPVCCSGDPDG